MTARRRRCTRQPTPVCIGTSWRHKAGAEVGPTRRSVGAEVGTSFSGQASGDAARSLQVLAAARAVTLSKMPGIYVAVRRSLAAETQDGTRKTSHSTHH